MTVQAVCLSFGLTQVPDLDCEVIGGGGKDVLINLINHFSRFSHLSSGVELHNGDLVTVRSKSTRRLVHLINQLS